MLRQKRGSIVNVSSIAGLAGVADRSAYNASKHGLIGLTRTLAAEWGGHGVRVNAVCPGWVKTEMDAADQAGGSYSDQDIISRIPMGRFAHPKTYPRSTGSTRFVTRSSPFARRRGLSNTSVSKRRSLSFFTAVDSAFKVAGRGALLQMLATKHATTRITT
jgi:NAD(P)-dependent dehydrogenase (short-subunit alcohol dehydrogenase family)